MAKEEERDQFSAYTPVMSTAAVIASVLAYLEARKTRPTDGVVIPDELLQAIAAIAETCQGIFHRTEPIPSIEEICQAILDAIRDPEFSVHVKAWPASVTGIQTRIVTCASADVGYPVPFMEVPDGMLLVVKSHPLNPALSLVRLASTKIEAVDPTYSYPLLPNEAISWRLTNANKLFVSSTAAGSVVIFSTEKAQEV